MSRSPLFGRRIHIAGSVDKDPAVATADAVNNARELLKVLIPELLARGATFVIPVDDEKVHPDGRQICFEWLVWEELAANLHRRPANAHNPLAIAIQHHKTEGQIPAKYQLLWDKLRGSDLVEIKNAWFWNMGAKRLELAAQWGDVLLTVGGADGVMFMADLYHQAGKPVIPLPDLLCAADTGSRRLFAMGLQPISATKLFRTRPGGAVGPDGWVNRLNSPRAVPKQRAETILKLLEEIEPPTAFAVRLLNDKHPDFLAVENYFQGVVKPVIEDELGYTLKVVDGKQKFEQSRIDQEIFARLAQCRLVVADLTGERPNCFLETGVAIGREVPLIISCRQGGNTYFDLTTVATHVWDESGTLDERRRKFREHVEAVRDRARLLPSQPLVS